MEKVKKVALWVLAGLLLLSGLGWIARSPVTGFLYILAAAVIAPVPVVQDFLSKLNVKGVVKVVLVLALLTVGTAVSPKDEEAELPERAPTEAAEETAAAPEDTAEPEPTPEPETQPEPEPEPTPEPEPEPEPTPEPVPEPEPTPEPEPEPEPQDTEEETQFSIETCIELFKISLASSYGENFSVERNDNVVMIYVWGENVTLGAFAAKGGNQEALDAWNVLLDSLKEMSLTYQGILRDNGHSDIHVAVGVKNDLNKDNVIATILSGVVIYDIVNDIALET